MTKILVCGATSAIVSATCRYFAKDGAEFYLVGRDSEKLEIIAADLKGRGAAKIIMEVVDVLDRSTHDKLINKATESLGGLDILYIGYGSLSDQARCEKDLDYAFSEFNCNALSVLSLVSIAANRFETQGKGTIAVISSVAGDRGRKKLYWYGAAKGTVSIFLEGLRNRLQPKGVQVLTVKPGFVDTPMTAEFKKGLLFASADTVGQGIYNAIKKGKDVSYLPWFWWYIMFIIKHIPEVIFKRLSI